MTRPLLTRREIHTTLVAVALGIGVCLLVLALAESPRAIVVGLRALPVERP